MKKTSIIVMFLIIITGAIYFVFSKSEKSPREEQLSSKVIDKEIEADVYSTYKISELIDTIEYNLIDDKEISYKEIGKDSLEFVYMEDNQKIKGKANVKVVDKVEPVILGLSSINVRVGSKDELIYKVLSADNYDSKPQREIIGNYDINKVGSYKLIYKITDSSGNEASKNFTLNVLTNLPRRTSLYSRTNYKDVYNEHKSDKTMIGLDISKWQGDVNFNLLKENNVEFIMLRIGYQQGFSGEPILDSYFLKNITKAQEVGIPIGGYFYSYATTKEEAISQAKFVVEAVKKYNISMPLVFDWESWSRFSSLGLSINDLNEIAASFLDEIRKNNYEAMNYSSKYYLNHIWNLNDYPVWLAHYTKKTDYEGPYDIWQLTDSGKIPGINGDVDINVMYLNK